MKLSGYKNRLLTLVLAAIQTCFLISCSTKVERIGFLGFYLDMDRDAAKSKMDSLLKVKILQYFESNDLLGNNQTSLYCDFSKISPLLSAKVNLRSTYIVDERLTSIRLNLCNRSKDGKNRFSDDCDLNQINLLFESYVEKYGKPARLGPGEQYDWLSKELPTVYLPGPKGRLIMDKIFFWGKGNYIIYFDFGYPEHLTKSDSTITKSDSGESLDWTSVPIIYYDFTRDYTDRLLEKASQMKEGDFRKKR
jgi:hypothetical protein